MQQEEQLKVKEMQALSKYSMLRDNDPSDEADEQSDSEGEVPSLMTQYHKDLQTIKDRKKQEKEQLAQLQSEAQTKLSKRDEKQMKKIMKEQDKLERQALVARMQMKDQERTTQKNVGSIVENQEYQRETLDKPMVDKLRAESRKAYLKQREEQVMDQWRRNLDDEKRVFGNVNLTQIEKRLAELKED